MPADSEPHDIPETDERDLQALPDFGDTNWLAYLHSRPNRYAKVIDTRGLYEAQQEMQNQPVRLSDQHKQAVGAFMAGLRANTDMTTKLAVPGVRSSYGNAISNEIVDKAHRACRNLCKKLEGLERKRLVEPLTIDHVISGPSRLAEYATRLKRLAPSAPAHEQAGYQQVQDEIEFLLSNWKQAGMDTLFTHTAIRSSGEITR